MMNNHETSPFARAIETLKAEILRLQEINIQSVSSASEEEKQRQREITRAISLLSGKSPVFAHLYFFGEDINVSLHTNMEEAIEDVKNVWTENEYDPGKDGSILFSVRLNGEAGNGIWTLMENGSLMSRSGDELIGFSIYDSASDSKHAAMSEEVKNVMRSIDWNRYELTAQIVATQKLTIDDDCTFIDRGSIEEITSTTLVIVRDVLHDIVFDVYVEGMNDESIIVAIANEIHEHEAECEARK
jgi:hypothetical protein